MHSAKVTGTENLLRRQLRPVLERYGMRLLLERDVGKTPDQVWVASTTAREAQDESAIKQDVWSGLRGAVSGYLYARVGADRERNERLLLHLRVWPGLEMLPDEIDDGVVHLFAQLGLDA